MFASKDLFFTKPSGGYQISRSVRLRSSASGSFTRTLSASGTTDTWSMWVKRGKLGTAQGLFDYSNGSTSSFGIEFTSGDALTLYSYSSGFVLNLITSSVYRDPSAWYHIVCVIDTTQATSTNRAKIYVNGVQVTAFSTATYPAQNTSLNIANSVTYGIGVTGTANSQYFDGYLTEINFIDGQALTPTSFGQTNSVTGVWQPIKYTGTYGTNGFYLNFSDNSAATAAAIGKDYSGNANNWTPNNISVTAGVTYDSMVDSPTVGATSSNHAVLNPLSTGLTISSGNLAASAGAAHRYATSTIIPSSGKWYWEVTLGTTCSGSVQMSVGVGKVSSNFSVGTNPTTNGTQLGIYCVSDNGVLQPVVNGSSTAYSTSSTGVAGSIYQCAFDADNGKLYFGVNNVFYSSTMTTTGNPSSGTNETISGLTGELFAVLLHHYSNSSNTNFGQRPFTYTLPTGFVALNTQNLPTPTISNGANYMAASTYTGNGSTQSIVNSGNNTGAISFKPDLVWIKSRSAATDHKLTDSVRGATKALISDTTGAETTDANGMTAFNTGGFSVGTDTNYNNNTATYVAWQWQAGAGSSSSNTSGSITSTVSVNATAGFSIVTYTGTGANATVGHGLGVAPKMVIVKRRNASPSNWVVWHTALAGTEYILLNTTGAKATLATVWNSTTPTSSVFSVGTDNDTNGSTNTVVAYCFAEVAGYSKFGSYTGNGSTDGPFVYCGFRPRFLMIKRTDSTGFWTMLDSSRLGYNVTDKPLYANASNAESTAQGTDFIASGFKVRATDNDVNTSGGTYIFMAVAENPFKLSLAR